MAEKPINVSKKVRKKVKLIINADDLGLCRSVNEAIMSTFMAGNLTSATMMVNMPGSNNAMELIKGGVGPVIGLHFNLTEGRPVSKANSFVGSEGYFLPRKELIKRIILKQIDLAEIQEELLAQMEVLERNGIPFYHVDSHQHILMIPQIFNAVQPILEQKGKGIRVVRPTAQQKELRFKRPMKYLRSMFNIWSAERIKKKYTCRTNDFLVSIHDLQDPRDFNRDTYRSLIMTAPEQSVLELMVHPYILNDDVTDLYATSIQSKMPFLQKCEREHDILSGEPLFSDFDLISFKDLR